jgi:putative ATP-dependent endonuclease of the OLD family
MYLKQLRISNFRHFGEGAEALMLELNEGLTAIVGENDSGKTAIVDALRMVLGTRDHEYFRLQSSDFHYSLATHTRAETITVRCLFEGLTPVDRAAFVEHLTYSDGKPSQLHVTWTARRTDGKVRGSSPEWRSGPDGEGAILDFGIRELLMATYLRPLRDADKMLSAGRGSRLAQILENTAEVTTHGVDFDPGNIVGLDPATLSVLGLLDFANFHLEENAGVKKTRERLNKDFLTPLSFVGDPLSAQLSVSSRGEDKVRLRQMLEKLEVILNAAGISDGSLTRGLGSNNVLFMACELLLLADENEGYPLLIIEEPEAHLHPQRQLRLMTFLQDQVAALRADGQRIQIIVTTHSPNLASDVKLNNILLLKDRKGFSLAAGKTALEPSDYAFLQRYLDVTKANLFFARRVLIVEGPAEELLMPALAGLMGKDFGKYGVSVVNVGGTGLGRFARIFQRADIAMDGEVRIPVACVTDMDVMPDCAPEILGLVKTGEGYPVLGAGTRRRWRAKRDFAEGKLAERRAVLRARTEGQSVRSFVADEWTLEYDLALAGLAEELFVASKLAAQDEAILNSPPEMYDGQVHAAKADFQQLLAEGLEPEELATKVYRPLAVDGTSKAITAQYLARYLSEVMAADATFTGDVLKGRLPPYILGAIEYVTEPFEAPAPPQAAVQARPVNV